VQRVRRSAIWVSSGADNLWEDRFHANYPNPGITTDAAGHRIIGKEHPGVRIFLQLDSTIARRDG
jgi:hypothetical protein